MATDAIASRVRSGLLRTCPTSPAAWLEVAAASSPCSRIWMSGYPARARQYATAHPMAPPPTIVTSASRSSATISALAQLLLPQPQGGVQARRLLLAGGGLHATAAEEDGGDCYR